MVLFCPVLGFAVCLPHPETPPDHAVRRWLRPDIRTCVQAIRRDQHQKGFYRVLYCCSKSICSKAAHIEEVPPHLECAICWKAHLSSRNAVHLWKTLAPFIAATSRAGVRAMRPHILCGPNFNIVNRNETMGPLKPVTMPSRSRLPCPGTWIQERTFVLIILFL